MREIYSSPRQENIERIVALLQDNDIVATVVNRSEWKKPSYQRFSYSQKLDDRSAWPQVWVEKADDYPRARALLRDVGLEPAVRFADELAASRQPPSPQRVASRVRLMALAVVAGVFLVVVLKATQVL
jgi:broad specificity phosphatase PhoE